MERTRCGWAAYSETMQRYHDEEWSVPRFDDAGQFEFLTLETAQAGLWWKTGSRSTANKDLMNY